MTISITPLAVLFDADGVLQQPTPDWQNRLARLAGASDRREAFLTDVFAAETPSLTGHADFRTQLSAVLTRWNSPGSVDDALAIWTEVQVDHAALALVDELRAAKVRCYLTTNQHALRARYMSETLGYATRFDREFYSCQLGYAKPSREYFHAVLDAIALPASRVVFIDDHPANVEAARGVGLHAALFDAGAGADMLRCHVQAFGALARAGQP